MAEIYVDMKEVIANRDAFATAIKNKNIGIDIDEVISLYQTRLADEQKLQEFRTQKNEISAKIPSLTGDDKATAIKESKIIGDSITAAETALKATEDKYNDLLWRIPNIPSATAPLGKSDEDNVVIRKEGTPKSFDFPIKSHYDLLIENDWADFERIAKVSGTRAYCLKGAASRLELALHAYMMDKLTDKGFTMLSVPSMIKGDAPLYGTGHFPYAKEDVYYMPEDDIYLSATAEVVITSLHSGEIFEESKLPVLYAGYSPCFRREAGAAGKDTRGLVRVHQFMKVEQYVICKADLAEQEKWHKTLLTTAEEVLQDLELPYQVIECCTGDMGAGKYTMNDIEAWMPSQDKYRETHSCSSLTDWQARRANLRYRENGTGKVRFCYTLNNTGIATPRIIAQFLENHQTTDGRVRIPAKLQPYMNGKEFL